MMPHLLEEKIIGRYKQEPEAEEFSLGNSSVWEVDWR